MWRTRWDFIIHTPSGGLPPTTLALIPLPMTHALWALQTNLFIRAPYKYVNEFDVCHDVTPSTSLGSIGS